MAKLSIRQFSNPDSCYLIVGLSMCSFNFIIFLFPNFSNGGSIKDKHIVEVKYATGGNSLSAEAFEQRLIAHMISKLGNNRIDFNSKEVKLELQKQCKILMKQFVDNVSREYKRFTV